MTSSSCTCVPGLRAYFCQYSSLSVSVSLCSSGSLFVSLSVSLWFFLHVCISVPVYVSFCSSLSLSPLNGNVCTFVSLYDSLCVSVHVCLCMYFCLCCMRSPGSKSLFVGLCVKPPTSLSVFVCTFLSVYVSLSSSLGDLNLTPGKMSSLHPKSHRSEEK